MENSGFETSVFGKQQHQHQPKFDVGDFEAAPPPRPLAKDYHGNNSSSNSRESGIDCLSPDPGESPSATQGSPGSKLICSGKLRHKSIWRRKKCKAKF